MFHLRLHFPYSGLYPFRHFLHWLGSSHTLQFLTLQTAVEMKGGHGIKDAFIQSSAVITRPISS